MDLNLALKKIRTQIKFGRGIEAAKSLQLLLEEHENTEDEKEILKVFAFELLMKKKDYKRAIPVLQRLLDLDTDDQTKGQAFELLNVAIKKESLPQSDPDTSSPEFLDYIDTIRRGEIFASADNSPVPLGYVVIDDMATAEELAWHQEVKKPFQSWNSLRTNASKQIHNYYYENKINMHSAHANLANEIGEICKRNLSPAMMNFYDDIYADLALIGMGKLVNVVPDLHAKMWSAYKIKAFPCGWRGNYPKGELCIFRNI